MGRRLRYIVLEFLGGLAVVGGLTAALVWGDSRHILNGCTLTAPMGWTVPLASVFVIAGVAWLLLSQDRTGSSSMGDDSVECSTCGRSVMNDWRLCPYCGAVFEGDEREPGVAGR